MQIAFHPLELILLHTLAWTPSTFYTSWHDLPQKDEKCLQGDNPARLIFYYNQIYCWALIYLSSQMGSTICCLCIFGISWNRETVTLSSIAIGAQLASIVGVWVVRDSISSQRCQWVASAGCRKELGGGAAARALKKPGSWTLRKESPPGSVRYCGGLVLRFSAKPLGSTMIMTFSSDPLALQPPRIYGHLCRGDFLFWKCVPRQLANKCVDYHMLGKLSFPGEFINFDVEWPRLGGKFGLLRNSASSFHWLSSSIFSCSFGCPASVTSPLISTIWCFRAYKP